MKKVIVLALAALLSVGAVSANNGKRLLQIGVHGGLISNADFESATADVTHTFEAASSYYAGLALRVNIPVLPIYVQPELDYMWHNYTNEALGENTSATFNTMRAPVLVGVGLGGNAFKIRANAGPVFDFGAVGDNNFAGWEEFGKTFEKSTVSWTAGLGLDISKLSIDFRYNGEFADQDVNFENAIQKMGKQSTWSLSLGLMF